jgi:hypothetical protein
MKRRFLAIGTSLAILGFTLSAQSPAVPRFRFERPIDVTSAGPQRLDVDVSLLAGGKPFSIARDSGREIATGGLGDLRLFNASNQEVPYLLIDPPATKAEWQTGRVLPVAQTEKTSGFEADFGEPSVVDAIEIRGIDAPFLKRLTLEGSGDREHWTLLIAEGTLFDLPSQSLQQTTLSFTAGPYRFLRITWNDTNSGRVGLPPSVLVRRVPQGASPAPVLRAPLSAERRPSEPGISRFRIPLPAGRLPIAALELTVDGDRLLRPARVTEAVLVGEQAVSQTLGEATLRRVVRDGIAAEALRIPIEQPHEAQLDLVVDDGDNPPLDLKAVTAVFAELPWIYFEQPPGTLTARYGNAKAEAPRYDLEAARASITHANVSSARWGEAAMAAVANEEPSSLAMPETGSTLQANSFAYSRSIAAGSGLVSIPLDAAVLAHSASIAGGFADVRVLDGGGRQVPYLLERREEPIALEVRVEARELPASLKDRQQNRSVYVAHLPFAVLPNARLALHTRARVFQRGVTMAQVVPPSARRRETRLDEMVSLSWRHSIAETSARALVFNIPETRVGDLVFLVDEGDNQRLPIEKATLLLPSYAIRLYQPAQQPLRLVYGRRDLGAPRYDLALLSPRVFGSSANEVYAGREESSGERADSPTIISPPVFYVSLGLAVVVLLVLIVRLVRRDEAAVNPGS